MDSTASETKTPACSASGKNQHKITLYMSFVLLIGVGLSPVIHMDTALALPLLSIAGLLTADYMLKENRAMRAKIDSLEGKCAD